MPGYVRTVRYVERCQYHCTAARVMVDYRVRVWTHINLLGNWSRALFPLTSVALHLNVLVHSSGRCSSESSIGYRVTGMTSRENSIGENKITITVC